MARERKIYPTRMSGGRLGAAHIYQVGRFSLSAFPLMPTSPPTMFDRFRRRHTSNNDRARELPLPRTLTAPQAALDTFMARSHLLGRLAYRARVAVVASVGECFCHRF